MCNFNNEKSAPQLQISFTYIVLVVCEVWMYDNVFYDHADLIAGQLGPVRHNVPIWETDPFVFGF